MKHALWYCDKPPTDDDRLAASQLGYALVRVEDGISLANVDTFDGSCADAVYWMLLEMGAYEEAEAVFGAFTPPLHQYISESERTLGGLPSSLTEQQTPETLLCFELFEDPPRRKNGNERVRCWVPVGDLCNRLNPMYLRTPQGG